MNHEMELLNAVLETGDMPLALNSNVDRVFEVYGDLWGWIKGYYDKYGQLPEKDKVGRTFSDFDFLNTSGSLQYYIDEAHKVSNTLKLKEGIIDIARELDTHGPDAAMKLMGSLSSKLVKETGKVKDTNLVLDYYDRIEKLRDQIQANEEGRGVLGIPTQIEPFDFHYGGFQPGDFVVVIGWTGSMKTWLSRLFAIRAWKVGYRPLVISLEMNKYQEGYRFDTILNQGVNFRNSQLAHGRDIDVDEYANWVTTTFEGKQDFFLVTNEGLDEVDQNMVEAKILQYQPDMVVLDYHGLFDDAKGGRTETEKAKNLSKDFKRLAVKLQVPIIDVAAVTMDDGGHALRPPELNEIAWSKQLSYDADLVLAVYRAPDSQLLNIISRKNRRGDLFAFSLAWDIDRGRIEELYD